MPIAFKDWAVTVRALAEGEQLVALRKGGIREENKHFEVEHEQFFLYPTFDHQRNDLVRESHHPELRRALAEGEQLVALRKGGIREEHKHFEVEHDQFFLYPTFDHQRNDLVRESHHPELRRALEEGVWPDEEPPPRALLQDGGIPQPDRVRIRAWAEITDHYTTEDHRVVEALTPFHVWTPDYAQKRLAWKRRHPLHVLLLRVHRIPRPVTVRVKDEYHGCRTWVEIDRDLPFEGTPVMADEEFDRAAAAIREICEGEPVPA